MEKNHVEKKGGEAKGQTLTNNNKIKLMTNL